MKSRQASRKLAYGFSFSEESLDEANFIKDAKQQLESLPDFNPWQYIAEFDGLGINVGVDDLKTDSNQKTELSFDKSQKKEIQRFLKEKSCIDPLSMVILAKARGVRFQLGKNRINLWKRGS